MTVDQAALNTGKLLGERIIVSQYQKLERRDILFDGIIKA
jgi:hypothetical protein